MTQLLLGISPDWHPELDNFVPGRNLELLSSLRQSLLHGGSVYLWGEPGCGKSHLLKALIKMALAQGLSAVYAQSEVPVAHQVVAVDQVENLDANAQIALFSLFNQQRESGGMIAVCGSTAPVHLNLRDDLRTRLGWGLVYQVHALNEVEKSLALQQHATERGLDLPPEVTQYLLRHGRRDLPSLLRILDEVDTECLRLKKHSASIPVLKEVMGSSK